MGRKIIDEHETDPLIAMMDLTIAAGDSNTTIGGSVQFYKDFPRLLGDTHALVKAASAEDLKKVNKTRFVSFYKVLASHANTKISLGELDRISLTKYDYEQIIGQQIEVQKFDQALKFADYVKAKFGSTYSYGYIASSLGSAGTDQQITAFTKHPSFAKYKNRVTFGYIERLYWSGNYDSALIVFESLNKTEKATAIRGQLPFVTECAKCDI